MQKLNIAPHRKLEEDMTLQTGVMSYGGNGVTTSVPPGRVRGPGNQSMSAADKKARWEKLIQDE